MPRASSATAARTLDAAADPDRLDDLFDDDAPLWVRAARKAQADRDLGFADIGEMFNTAADPTLCCDGLDDLFPPSVKESNAYALSFDEIFALPEPEPAPLATPSSAIPEPTSHAQPDADGLHAQVVSLVAELQRFTDEFHAFAAASQRGTPLFIGPALFNY